MFALILKYWHSLLFVVMLTIFYTKHHFGGECSDTHLFTANFLVTISHYMLRFSHQLVQ